MSVRFCSTEVDSQNDHNLCRYSATFVHHHEVASHQLNSRYRRLAWVPTVSTRLRARLRARLVMVFSSSFVQSITHRAESHHERVTRLGQTPQSRHLGRLSGQHLLHQLPTRYPQRPHLWWAKRLMCQCTAPKCIHAVHTSSAEGTTKQPYHRIKVMSKSRFGACVDSSTTFLA